MASSGPPPDVLARMFEDTMARARGRLAAIERACDDLAGLRDDAVAAKRRHQLLDGLVDEFGCQPETTCRAEQGAPLGCAAWLLTSCRSGSD